MWDLTQHHNYQPGTSRTEAEGVLLARSRQQISVSTPFEVISMWLTFTLNTHSQRQSDWVLRILYKWQENIRLVRHVLRRRVVGNCVHRCEQGERKVASLLTRARDVFIYEEVFCQAVIQKYEWAGHGSKSNSQTDSELHRFQFRQDHRCKSIKLLHTGQEDFKTEMSEAANVIATCINNVTCTISKY